NVDADWVMCGMWLTVLLLPAETLKSSQPILCYTSSATANAQLNIRGNSGTTLSSLLSVGQSITVAFGCTNGATAKYVTGIQIDGSSSNVLVKWQGGSAPSFGNANSEDWYIARIEKTSTGTTPHSFVVYASQTRFS
uniref:hypothetical protein n=1 Tax=Candidatus Magnetaquicoccus inordinatus TaxID=2496818 RepID=UPI001D0E6D18